MGRADTAMETHMVQQTGNQKEPPSFFPLPSTPPPAPAP
jgi:hypothetical protein